MQSAQGLAPVEAAGLEPHAVALGERTMHECAYKCALRGNELVTGYGGDGRSRSPFQLRSSGFDEFINSTGNFTPAYLEHIPDKGTDGSHGENAVDQLTDFLVGEQFRIFQILLQMSATGTQSIGTLTSGFFGNLTPDGIEFHLGFVCLSLGFSLSSQKFLKGLFLSHIIIFFLDKV